ncbi:MAG TPA: alkene reductase [Gemmatimonadaceae bacterium]|nr:alkene reductase [Gemmatimonadaceae bacterium]
MIIDPTSDPISDPTSDPISAARPGAAGTLLSPVQLGPVSLPNRIVMAPMTRSRADAVGNLTAMMADYYRQRASAGLIITEGVVISPRGKGYPNTPGIFTGEQLAGWTRVVEAVHGAGGRIFAQLWHVGRVSHPLLQPDGALPVAPSALAVPGELYTNDGMKAFVAPRSLETGEIAEIVDQFRRAAMFARQAGFDGVELHAANGYLIDQFLRDGSNLRTDRYGGSVANRARFLLEVVDAVSGVYGADRVGVRLSPLFSMMGMYDSAPDVTFHNAASALSEFGLAYMHVVEQRSGAFDWRGLRSAFGGIYMANGGYDRASAEAAIHTAHADLVSFGTPYIANPDLTERFRWGTPLSAGDRATYYGGGAQGYTDYATLELEDVMDVAVGVAV